MKKCAVVLAGGGVLILGLVVRVFASELVWQEIAKGIFDLKTVLVDPTNPKVIYIGASDGVFKTEDGAGGWRNILSLRGGNRRANFLLSDPKDRNALYAATGNGLFYTSNQGKNWKRIFRGRNSEENNCLSLAILKPEIIYLGTASGLFVTQDAGKTWHKQSGELGNIPILSLAEDAKNNLVYAAGANKVFKIENEPGYYRQIFTKGMANINNGEGKEEWDREELPLNPKISDVAVDPNLTNQIYLASDSGVYLSQDQGLTWSLISNFGLLSKEVKFILLSPSSDLYSITKSGIFLYKDERWQELSLRLPTLDIRFLAIDHQNNLYAATDKGIFRAAENTLSGRLKDSSEYFKDQPTIQELHQATIKYAQVIDPEKIEDLRKQARIKAILPELSVDYDRTITSYSNTASTRFTVGPSDWGISLKWSLSDLIWSEQQRLIDSQVRLMVQLRDDILDEVTKFYFERIRLKMELDNLSLEDRKKRLEKELRLEELTASLDALTGGYFSQHLKEKG